MATRSPLHVTKGLIYLIVKQKLYNKQEKENLNLAFSDPNHKFSK